VRTSVSARICSAMIVWSLLRPHTPSSLNETRSVQTGLAYTVRVTTRVSGTGTLANHLGAEGNWTGTAIVARDRGRIDISEGELPGFFRKGDFVLFDASDAIVVHPADKSFAVLFPYTRDSTPRLMNSTGIRTSLTNLIVMIDSGLPSETIEGRLASHYRIKATYNLTIDVSSITGLEASPNRSSAIDQVTDYYYADLPLPQAFVSFNPAAVFQLPRMPDYLQELNARLAVMTAGLPKNRTSLRTVATTKIVSSEMSLLRETTTEILQVQNQNFEVDTFLLPMEYRESSGPGTNSDPASRRSAVDAGTKWRRPPLTR
jgi:hypothetical protein